jgi:hypothetical protein
MKYSELTQQQRNTRQKVWVKFLDKYCRPVLEDGTRACDLYGMCDRCQYDLGLKMENILELNRLGEPLIDEEMELLADREKSSITHDEEPEDLFEEEELFEHYEKDYGSSNPWDAPRMSIRDFI